MWNRAEGSDSIPALDFLLCSSDWVFCCLYCSMLIYSGSEGSDHVICYLWTQRGSGLAPAKLDRGDDPNINRPQTWPNCNVAHERLYLALVLAAVGENEHTDAEAASAAIFCCRVFLPTNYRCQLANSSRSCGGEVSCTSGWWLKCSTSGKRHTQEDSTSNATQESDHT
jgi:hypothetical protein